MRLYQFIVKIPNPEKPEEHKEITFNSKQEVADFLQVTPNTVYTYSSGRMKLLHKSKKKLEGISITRVDLPSKNPQPKKEKKTEEEIKAEKKEFQKKLFESIKS